MSILRYLLPGFGTCIAYLLTGALGLMIALPPSYASLLWLPAGISLGMTLQYGPRALYGVFLGSFLLHVYIASGFSVSWFELILEPLPIALGAALEALAGAWLVRRFIGHPLALHQPRQVACFIWYSGPIACAVSGLIGPLSMWAAQRFPAAELPSVILTWWIGDSLGVIMVLPLMLVLFRPLRESWMPPVRRVALPLFLICIGALAGFHLLSQNEQQHQRDGFTQYAEMQRHSLQMSLSSAVDALHALSGFVTTVPELTPDNFRQFSAELLELHPELHGISWNPSVPAGQLAAFERHLSRLYGEPFSVRSVEGAADPEGRRVVVGFIAPFEENRSALGLNVQSDPARRSALLKAAGSGLAIPTEPIQLAQETGSQAGVLIFLPVYHGAPATEAERFTQLRGYATAVVRVGDLVRQSIGHALTERSAVTLMDMDAPRDSRLLFRSDNGLDANQLERRIADNELPILMRSRVELGGRTWELVQYAQFAYIDKPETLYYLLCGVFLLSGLYSWLLLVMAGQRNQVQLQVADRTRQLALSHSMLAEVQRIAGLSQWVWQPGADGHRWSEGFRALLGDCVGEASLELFLARVQPGHRDRVRARFEDWLQGDSLREPLDCELLPAAGQVRYIELQSDWVSDGQGRRDYLSIVARDISDRWRAEEQIRRLAYYDSLTGLPNRDLFHENLRQQIVQGRRSGYFGALLFIDLDNFKSLNDTLGHSVGDQLLKDVTERLRQGLREQDIISRFGGDEFLILLPCTCPDEAAAAAMGAGVAQKVIDLLRPPFLFGSYSHSVSASVGVTLVPQGTAVPEVLVMQADTAMYHAKGMGKGCFAHYRPDMQAELVQQVQLEQELRQALQQGQLELHYQPQFDRERRLVGAEALVRWRHPVQGLLLPGSFIRVAEETGLIGPLGEWVLDNGVRQLGDWNRAGLSVARLSINISPNQLNDAGFISRLDERVAAAGIAPLQLCLELTEQVLLPQASPVHQRIDALRERGYEISIDDFGTGYSSLNYLKKLPFNELKIAREFVRDLPWGRRDAVLVKTILSMARTLGVDAIAEGVESVEQYEYLRQIGCPRFQGFYLARPMPAEQFERLLATDYAVEAEPEFVIVET
ncbi:MAG: EAL domain-containing protein [Oceanospirillaceae bacterium]|nr:EAL domain-containing protein [Oceanospirillaceae bacterium]